MFKFPQSARIRYLNRIPQNRFSVIYKPRAHQYPHNGISSSQRFKSSAVQLSNRPSTHVEFTVDSFIELETELSRIKTSADIDEKINFLLRNHHYVDIFDINLRVDEYPRFFHKLVNDYQVDFNETDILGIGKLLKVLASMPSDRGIALIKNCGILNSKNGTLETLADDVYINKYNNKLRVLTIDSLLKNKYYREAFRFLKIFETVSPNSKETAKYFFKLSKFNKDIELTPADIIDNSLVHIYLRELLKSDNYTLKEKLEYFLLILYKTLDIQNAPINNLPPLNPNQVHNINTVFLSLLYNQKGVPYSVFVSYFIQLYPKSVDMLIDLNLLSKENPKDNPIFTEINSLPNVNIRSELINEHSYPYIEELSMLYSKFLSEKHLNKYQIKTFFKKYCSSVLQFQNFETIDQSNNLHPFSKLNHDSSVLNSFINHTFNNSINGLSKPLLSLNLILKFYNSLEFSNLDYSKSKNIKNHKHQLQELLNYFLNMKNFNSNIPKAIELLTCLSNVNIYLDIKIYLKLIDSLISISCFEDAKSIYDFVCNNPSLSAKLEPIHISKYCYKYSWPYPAKILAMEHYSTDNSADISASYNADFLTGNMSPQNLISYLDSMLKSDAPAQIPTE